MERLRALRVRVVSSPMIPKGPTDVHIPRYKSDSFQRTLHGTSLHNLAAEHNHQLWPRLQASPLKQGFAEVELTAASEI